MVSVAEAVVSVLVATPVAPSNTPAARFVRAPAIRLPRSGLSYPCVAARLPSHGSECSFIAFAPGSDRLDRIPRTAANGTNRGRVGFELATAEAMCAACAEIPNLGTLH